MTITNVNIFTPDFDFQKGALSFDGERITNTQNGEVIDGQGMYLIPGLIDLHFHGCVGYDFCDGTPESLQAIADYQAQSGTTAIAPASMTLPEEVLAKVFQNAANHTSKQGAILCGINMEGPFFSSAKKGAQNGEYLKNPEMPLYKRLQTAAKGLIKLVDVAPELPNALPFIKKATKEVVVSVAHTAANYEEAKAGFDAGATHVTHLYNAMTGFSHREPGILGAAFDSGANAELICDGVHVADSTIRITFALLGAEHIILISDSMRATGLTDGTYDLGGQEVTVKGNKATLKDGTIAGSVTNLFDCVRHAIGCGIPKEDVIRAATYNPAKELGVLKDMGTLEPGKLANFLLVDKGFNLQAVYVKGKKI